MSAYKHQKESKRQRIEKRRSQLEQERVPYIAYWRDLASYILPRAPRFLMTDVNKATSRVNSKINDGTATLAARTLASNMMAWITSPSRPWLRLTVSDPEVADLDSVKEWCYSVTGRMLDVFARSRLYNSLSVLYKEMPTFGQSPMLIEEDFKDVIRTTNFPVGSYMVSRNEKKMVDTFCRDYRSTVRQLIDEHGLPEGGSYDDVDWSKFSVHVKQLWDEGFTETWVDVCHIIYPNPEFDPKKRGSKHKRYASCYFERGYSGSAQNYITETSGDQDRFLRESGYDYFPVLCPAWEVTGEDAYASDCPGMTALADVKSLQVNEKRSAQAIEKLVNPPTIADESLRHKRVSLIAGDVTYVPNLGSTEGLRPIYQVDPKVRELEEKSEQLRNRIKRAYFEDIFLMFSASQQVQPPTAREVDERHEEKILALGPVLEQLNQALLDPLVDITFKIMWDQGLIPEPPPELKGQDLKVEYISLMAQAQAAAGAGNLDSFVLAISGVAQLKPDVLDKLNSDKLVELIAETRGIDPEVTYSEEQTTQMRQAKAQLQAKQAQMEAIPAGAKAVKDLSQAETSGSNVLAQLVSAMKNGQLDLSGEGV